MKSILLAVFCLALCFACSDNVDEFQPVSLKKGHLGKDKDSGMVQVPFKADFTVWRAASPGSGDECDEGWFRETMEGEGNITHLGKMTTFMTFCVNPANLSYKSNVPGYFVAANGDTLFISPPTGQIIVPGIKEGYHAYFNDTMFFMGGTGRFVGASGYALTNAHPFFGSAEVEFYTDFFSGGVLKMKK